MLAPQRVGLQARRGRCLMALMDRPLVIWVVGDGKAGHEAQSMGLAGDRAWRVRRSIGSRSSHARREGWGASGPRPRGWRASLLRVAIGARGGHALDAVGLRAEARGLSC